MSKTDVIAREELITEAVNVVGELFLKYEPLDPHIKLECLVDGEVVRSTANKGGRSTYIGKPKTRAPRKEKTS